MVEKKIEKKYFIYLTLIGFLVGIHQEVLYVNNFGLEFNALRIFGKMFMVLGLGTLFKTGFG